MSDSSRPSDAPSEHSSEVRLPEDVHYIAIDGVIGAGKTTLARRLADYVEGALVLEQLSDNPFLERFYEEPDRWAFQAQLSFLASRFRQQKSLRARDLFRDLVVTDYTFDKDRIFAHVNLEADELQLYETLYTGMEEAVPRPDLVIYLQSTVDRLVEQIAERGRGYDESIERPYLEELNEAYNRYFFNYTKSPLLIVNADRSNFEEDGQLVELVRVIGSRRTSGITYFHPGSDAPFPHASESDTESDT